MSPPGWHTDPGYTGIGPAQERWWDGSQWTDQLRVPPAALRRRRVRIGAALTAAVVVLAAVGGGIYLLTDDSGHMSDSTATSPSAPPSDGPSQHGLPGGGGGESRNPDGRTPQTPQTEDGYATDAASGISIPVPQGWTGRSGAVGAGVTTGTYTCPTGTDDNGKPASCVRGGVFSAPAAALKLSATTAKGAAQKDISANATSAYGDSSGGITSHQEVRSEAVTVAGQQGYLVRWKVVTKKGDDGYVQSLAFPSPRAASLLIVVRSGFDINTKAPSLSVMDDITRGIKAASAPGTGSGENT